MGTIHSIFSLSLLLFAGPVFAQSFDTPQGDSTGSVKSSQVLNDDGYIRVMILGQKGIREIEGGFFGGYVLNAGYHHTLPLMSMGSGADIGLGLESGASFMLPSARPWPYLSVGPELRYQQLVADLHLKGIAMLEPEGVSSDILLGASGRFLFDPMRTGAELETGLEYAPTSEDAWRFYIGGGLAFR